MRKMMLLLSVLAVCAGVHGADTAVELMTESFPLERVRLLDGPFKQAMEKNQEVLLKLDVDRMLWPYHEHAGMPTKGERYGGWARKDCVGQISGHYLSALSLMYAASGKLEFKKRADYMVGELARVQKKNGNGYTGPVRPEVWDNTFDGTIEVHKWGLGTGYVPWYVMHKTFAGLIDAYQLTGNKQALSVVCALADWAKKGTDTLTEEQFQKSLQCEHGGMAETIANLYGITGNQDYLSLAKRFEHAQITEPLAAKRDELTGKHVNTQLPKILGSARLYESTCDERHSTVAKYFWDRVINERSFASGGLELREHFFAEGEESKHLAWNTCETCCVYNMLKLSGHLFRWTSDVRYMDYYERGLYNQILGSQDPESGGFTYFYSLKPGHFKIYSTPFDSMWCCVGTGMENHSQYGNTIYAHRESTLWVNLFIPSTLDWKEQGVQIRQETTFPDADTIKLSISTKRTQAFDLKVRVPYWATKGAMVWVNGKQETVEAKPESYLTLSRKWKDGDTVKVQLPMSLHLHRARDNKDMVVVMYGPLTLAGELGTEGVPSTFVQSSQAAHSGDMDPPVPVLLIGDKDLASCIKRVEGDVLRFKTVGIGSPEDVTLIPLHAMHHQRYTVYWDTRKGAAGVALEPAANVKAEDLAPGLDYKVYEGAWSKLPDFSKLEVKQSGTTEDIDISKRPRRDNFGIVFSGYLKIENDSECYLAATSDDGSAISLAGEQVVLNDGIHPMMSVDSGPLALKAGFYPLEVKFFEASGGEGLDVTIYDGKGGWKRVPRTMLFRKK